LRRAMRRQVAPLVEPVEASGSAGSYKLPQGTIGVCSQFIAQNPRITVIS
jgi:hypothetical protein